MGLALAILAPGLVGSSLPNQTGGSSSSQSQSRPLPESKADVAAEVTAHYTRTLAWFTGILAGIGAIQIGVAYVQIRYLIRADRIATENARAALIASEFAGKQVDLLTAQKDIVRYQYFAEHRPRLVIKSAFFQEGQEFRSILYELANIGGSTAKVVSGFVAVGFMDNPIMFWSAPKSQLVPPDTVIPPANVMLFQVSIPEDEAMTLRLSVGPGLGKREDLFFYGRIKYVDERGQEFGIIRESVFRRQWEWSTDRFLRTGDPDHEYAD